MQRTDYVERESIRVSLLSAAEVRPCARPAGTWRRIVLAAKGMCGVFLFLSVGEACGAYTSWTAADGNWETNMNWTQSEPEAGDYATVDGGVARIDRAGKACTMLYVGSSVGSWGKVTMTAGSLSVSSVAWIGRDGQGTFEQSGGSMTVDGSVYVGSRQGSIGRYDLYGGTLTGKGSLVVGYQSGSTGVFSGYGDVGLTHGLINNGSITADGVGANRVLSLKRFAWFDNTRENSAYNGWYAVRTGRLDWMSMAVSAGANRVAAWGETVDDVTPDLINSVRMELGSVTTAGTMNMSLLAADNALIAAMPTTWQVVGAWQFDAGGVQFGDAEATFRYDDRIGPKSTRAEELSVMAWDNGEWRDVTTSVDVSGGRASGAVTSGGTMIVAFVPEPSVILVLLMAIGAMCLFHRHMESSSSGRDKHTLLRR